MNGLQTAYATLKAMGYLIDSRGPVAVVIKDTYTVVGKHENTLVAVHDTLNACCVAGQVPPADVDAILNW